jgi:hypothetical protein
MIISKQLSIGITQNKLIFTGANPKEVLFLLKMMDLLIQLIELNEIEAITTLNSDNIYNRISRFDPDKITLENLRHYLVNFNNSQILCTASFSKNILSFIFNAISFAHIQLMFALQDIIKNMFYVEQKIEPDTIIMNFIHKEKDENIQKLTFV